MGPYSGVLACGETDGEKQLSGGEGLEKYKFIHTNMFILYKKTF